MGKRLIKLIARTDLATLETEDPIPTIMAGLEMQVAGGQWARDTPGRDRLGIHSHK